MGLPRRAKPSAGATPASPTAADPAASAGGKGSGRFGRPGRRAADGNGDAGGAPASQPKELMSAGVGAPPPSIPAVPRLRGRKKGANDAPGIPPSPTRTLIEARAPMKPGFVLPLVILVVGTAGVGYGGMTWKREAIQQDLRSRSLYALDVNGYKGIDVTFTGRDGVIVGTVDNVKDAALVHRIVRSRPGVRHVDDRLVVRGIGKKGASGNVTTLVVNPLNATIQAGTIDFTGDVPSEDARFALIGAAAAQVGNAYVIDALQVDRKGPRGVLSVYENFGRTVGTMTREGLQNGSVTLDKGTIRLDGNVWSEDLRKNLHGKAAALVGERNVSDGLVVVTTTAPTTTAPPTTVPPPTAPPTTVPPTTVPPTTVPVTATPTTAAPPATAAPGGPGGTGPSGGAGGTAGGTGPGGGLPTTVVAPAGSGSSPTVKPLAPMTIPSTTIDPATVGLRRKLESILTIRTIEFTNNSAELTVRGRKAVAEVAKVLVSDPTVAIEVGGHTDDVGTDADNLILSQARAATVRDALIRLGVPAARIRSTGYGEIAPVADNATPEGRARNRRIEFGLVKLKPGGAMPAPTTPPTTRPAPAKPVPTTTRPT